MENQETTIAKSSTPKYVWVILISAIILYSGLGFALYYVAKDSAKINTELREEKGLNSTCTYKRDSLIKENKELSTYKSLTQAMVHRDEAVSLLNHKVGDIVYMKHDSSIVVVEDIVIGGSKYQYYVKYKVLHKDNSSEEVIPELIY